MVPDAGKEAVGRIFGGDTRLDGVATEIDFLLRDAQRQPRRDAQLLAHEVNAGTPFGHWMLDLQTRVDLQEVELLSGPSRNSHVPALT